jgi:hypothetical protein
VARPNAIDRVTDRESDPKTGPERAGHTERERNGAAGQRPDVSADLRSDHRHSLQRRVQELVLKAGIALEHETKNRCEHQQQRKN